MEKLKSIIILAMLLVLSGCGSILQSVDVSLKQPTIDTLNQESIQTAGYFVGKKYPKVGNELLKYTQDFLNQEGNEVVNFQSWKGHVAKALSKDEFLQLKIERILSLVDVEVQLKEPGEKAEAIRELFKEFISGLEVGLKQIN